MKFKDVTDSFLDVVFPRNCVITGDLVEEDSPYRSISKSVGQKLFHVQATHCRTCGYPYFGAVMASDRACPKCKELKPLYGEGKTTILVEGIGRELIHKFKYEEATFLIQDFFSFFENCVGLDHYLDDAHLVPVPLHPRKFRERGFNQSEALCQALILLQPSAKMAKILERTIDTPSQTLFSRKERMRNLKNAFRLAPHSNFEASKRYLIVDDVVTTGSTVNACTRALRKGGIQRIDILTLGHG
ncbi:ComF family protein [Opitutia bacterium ISCC 51]|nr:ComF family protein [Opitutae bacterium ISCC 51]QXD28314.1 ComF family protein [Opitutae bacterium ISCC 52]